MQSLDDLARHIQSFLSEETDQYYSVFIIEEDSKTLIEVIRLPTFQSEQVYKISKEFDPSVKTTDDLILLAKMCVKTIENYLATYDTIDE